MASPSSSANERPSKKARPTETEKENSPNVSETDAQKVCRFRITNLEAKHDAYGNDFFVSLDVEKHGLYHLVGAVFDYKLHELSGDSIYSHLWKIQFDGKAFDSHLLLPEFGSVVCDAENPRLLSTFQPKTGQRGSFRGESGEFKFVVEEVSEADGEHYPKCVDIPIPVITASADSSFISNEEKALAMQRRKEYHDFYNGDNDWKMDRDCHAEVWFRCKPVSPAWGKKENVVIGLFLNGGWKFKKSWKNGLQYALLHRAETATSGRWYQLRKEKYYVIEDVGEGMTQDEMIIQAKKLCKSMMETTLAKGVPTPRPKPKTYKQIMQLLREGDGQGYEREMYQRAIHRNHETFDF